MEPQRLAPHIGQYIEDYMLVPSSMVLVHHELISFAWGLNIFTQLAQTEEQTWCLVSTSVQSMRRLSSSMLCCIPEGTAPFSGAAVAESCVIASAATACAASACAASAVAAFDVDASMPSLLATGKVQNGEIF